MRVQGAVHCALRVRPVDHARGPRDVDRRSRGAHVAFRPEQRRYRARLVALGVEEGHPHIQQVGHLGFHRHTREALANQDVVDQLSTVGSVIRAGEFQRILGDPPRARTGGNILFGLERRPHHREAFVCLADSVRIGHPHIVVEHDVGALVTHGVHRLDFDTGRIQRHQQHRQAARSHRSGLGAGEQEAIVGKMGKSCEDLLPVDNPFVAVAL